MAYLNSEAELAGVLGHEIGHVTARHSVRQQSASQVTGLLGGLLNAATGQDPGRGLFSQLGVALTRGYGRDHELQADNLGAQYLARIGYAPDNMINVISVLKNQELFEKSAPNVKAARHKPTTVYSPATPEMTNGSAEPSIQPTNTAVGKTVRLAGRVI